MLVVTTVTLIDGCDKKESEISPVPAQPQVQAVEKVEGRTVSKESKQVTEEPKKVKLETSMGEIVIELNEEAAPVTAKNFLRYVEEGFFDGTIFHRVIPDFMIQGGGFTADMRQRKTHTPIVNEADNGLKNARGTIAMARTGDPDSATSQFFINHKNNDFLNYAGPGKPGYAVFGKVTEGMETVDKIAAVKTTTRNGMADVPVEPVVIISAKVVLGK
jgi:cyclophilin family peptidyl-prolyl cis-trans isomerase